MIEAKNLTKNFKRIKKPPGIAGAIKSLIRPDVENLRAVDDLSLEIAPGEMVAVLGPNGAGKSTTIKMLTGILSPSSGSVKIGGLCPKADRKKVCSMLGVVFGQRSQLYWELRLGESYEVLRRIYRIEEKQYKTTISRLSEYLDIGDFMNVPVRQLSLGQRMRGEVAAALLHSPELLLLDEPTIGIDIEAKASIRRLIREQNEELGTTVLLTSHDVEDVSSICDRMVIINHGKLESDEMVTVESIKSEQMSDFVVDLGAGIPEGLLETLSDWVLTKLGERKYRCESVLGSPMELLRELESYSVLSISPVEDDSDKELRKASRLQETLLKHYRS